MFPPSCKPLSPTTSGFHTRRSSLQTFSKPFRRRNRPYFLIENEKKTQEYMFEFIITWGCGEKLNSKHSPGAARVTVGQARSPASRPDGASFGSFGGRGDKLIARLRLRVGAGVYKARRRSVLVECSGKQILKGGKRRRSVCESQRTGGNH